MTRLARWLISCIGGVALLWATTASAFIIVGAAAQGPPGLAIPLNASLLCDGTGALLNCPQFFSPDWSDTTGLRIYGITNRVNPPVVVVSVDGGTTFAPVTTQPYLAALDLFGAGFAVTSDGALLAPANQGTDNCIIRRSSDGGVSWSTVYTDTGATDNCGIRFATPTSNTMRCAQDGGVSGYCIVLNTAGGGGFTLISYFSLDSGITWIRFSGSSIVSADAEVQIKLGPTGSFGIAGIAQLSAGNGFPFGIGGGWDESAILTSNGARCWGGVIFGSATRVICGPSNILTTQFGNWEILGLISATLTTSFTVVDAPPFTFSPDFNIEGFNDTTAYMFGRNVAATRVNVYVTIDTFTSAIQIAQLNPTTALIAGACRGESHKWNNKIYFTCGGTGSSAFLGIVQ